MSEQLKNTLTALLILIMVVSTVITLVVTMPNLAGVERVIYENEESAQTTTVTSIHETVTESNAKVTQETTKITTTYTKATETRKDLININTATKDELMSIPGIGEVYADRILAFREENGKFETLNELTNIKGIGEQRLKKWSAYLSIS